MIIFFILLRERRYGSCFSINFPRALLNVLHIYIYIRKLLDRGVYSVRTFDFGVQFAFPRIRFKRYYYFLGDIIAIQTLVTLSKK